MSLVYDTGSDPRLPWRRGDWAMSPTLQRMERRDGPVLGAVEGVFAGPLSLFRTPRFLLRRFARQVIRSGRTFETMDAAGLDAAIAALGPALRCRGPRGRTLVESFALIREVTGRTLGMRHYPSQLMAGRVLAAGAVAELATGEGKTITGLLPAVTMALAGLPVHVVTVNAYLAERDAAELRPVFERFGLSVGLVTADMDAAEKAATYRSDVVFVTNKDVCFDYLRDGLTDAGRTPLARARIGGWLGRPSGQQTLLPSLPFALIDEVDLVLVDEARVPLIISGVGQDVSATEAADLALALTIARNLRRAVDFRVEIRDHRVTLTDAGRTAVRRAVEGKAGVWRARRGREERITQALAALHVYELGRHYVILDGAVQIVDEHTGRVTPGRAWEKGLHQLIELKEELDFSPRATTEAKITYQRFFRRYMRVAGMTGTASGLGAEFMRVFNTRIVRVRPHRRSRRRNGGVELYRDPEARWEAAVSASTALAEAGRPVLIGTRSVESSEALETRLLARGAKVRVLNAAQDAEEAQIVAEAGQAGAITIATSMAGRGTDIKLGPGVEKAGGLHVLMTEPHDSARIDRQLIGRGARQGDPGSYAAMIALDDELFRTHAAFAARCLGGLMGALGIVRLRGPLARVMLRSAQASAERRNGAIRRGTLKVDEGMDRMLGFAGKAR